MVRFGVLGLVLVLLLAGCSGRASDSKGALVAPSSTVSAGAGGTGGTIQGSVIDAEQVPMEGAQVAILSLGLAATTDAAGLFTFLDVPPGAYDVFAAKLGYNTATRRVTVAVGETSPVELVLEPLPEEKDWAQIFTERGHVLWGVRYVTPVQSQGVADGDIESRWETKDRADAMEAMVTELHWQGTQALAKGMRMRVEIRGQANVVAKSFAILEGRNPIIHTVNETHIQGVIAKNDTNCKPELCRIQWRVFTGTGNTGGAVDFGVMADQVFTGYVTHFYRMPPPPNYSAASQQ